MKTELRDFCVDYSAFASPLLRTLDESLSRMDDAGRAEMLGDARPKLADVQHRLKILVDKLEAQQAYLIIFGPLKSGKSTLMNAISGSYVSEVSSLPAYPCLVYVRDGEQQAFSTTSYGGQCRGIGSREELEQLVDTKHGELAEELKKAEEAGRTFDPATDYPDALRRIDISLPAADLAKSGVVLVDTPGLYTRMKFGYDLMTRDFRDAAACAVFVVKTENLFLEQVFAEFNKLLDIFSRVFLVVNIDGNKKDLAPDGSLRPSVESEAPQRVVEAFESLSMEAPLRKAFDEGRLNIYPIDLLSAAAGRLGSGQENTEEGTSAFDDFLADLSDYLNSSDYLFEFRRDSINQGGILAKELRDAVTGVAIERLRSACEGDREKREELLKRREAVRCITDLDWNAVFSATRRMTISEIGTMVGDAVVQLRGGLSKVLDEWFQSENSLKTLGEKGFGERIEAEAERLGEQARRIMKRHLGGAFAGAELESGAREALRLLEIDLAEISGDSVQHMGSEEAFAIKKFELDPATIPVRRRFFDYLFFRSPVRIRRKLFGDYGSRTIPVVQKERRLGDEAREYLIVQVQAFVKNSLADAMEKEAELLADRHTETLRDTVLSKLEADETALTDELEKLEKEIAELEHMLTLTDGMAAAVEDFDGRLSAMQTALEGSTQQGVESGEVQEESAEDDSEIANDSAGDNNMDTGAADTGASDSEKTDNETEEDRG
ncbi:hypothetical protein EGM51_05540 [Verrucomicrobia bacterium S94]|nr:hypothetical protein EGM51_05540 [Verrucomicrobia bacterium S94]